MSGTQNASPPTALEISAARRLIANGSAQQVRESANLSRQEVAQEVRCSANTVRRWEEGETKPHGDAAARYLRLLAALVEDPTGAPAR